MTQPILHVAHNLPTTAVSRTDTSAPDFSVGVEQETGFSALLPENSALSKMLDKLREDLTEDEYLILESWLVNGQSLPIREEIAGKLVPFLAANNELLSPHIREQVQQQLALQMQDLKQTHQSDEFERKLKEIFQQLMTQPDELDPTTTAKEPIATSQTQNSLSNSTQSLIPIPLSTNQQTDGSVGNMLFNISSSGVEGVKSTPLVSTGAAITGSQPSAATLSIPLGEPGWNQALGKQIHWMIGSQMQSASLKITPPHMGSVEINLLVKNEQAEIRFAAQHDQVREALETAIPRLREMFRDISLDLVNVDVGKKEMGGHTQFSTLVSDQGTKNDQRSDGYADMQDSAALTGNQESNMVVRESGSTLVDDYA